MVEEEVSVGERNFIITYGINLETFHGHVRPEPAHSGVAVHPEFGEFPSETKLDFRVDRANDPVQKGRFQQIETVPDEQRKGWAADMVRALLTFFPTTYWNNENLNEESGPFFMKMQAQFPERIAVITDRCDGNYRIAENPIPGA